MTAKRPRCDTPGCGRAIPVGGEGHPEICPTCLRAEAAMPKAVPPAWRVGTKVGRTLYLNDVLVGLMDTDELARTVVAAMNAAPAVETVKGTQGPYPPKKGDVWRIDSVVFYTFTGEMDGERP